MSTRQELHEEIDRLPPEALHELAEYIRGIKKQHTTTVDRAEESEQEYELQARRKSGLRRG